MNLMDLPPPRGRPVPAPPPVPMLVHSHQSPAVVGSLWPPVAEAPPPPRLVEWRQRSRRPMWAWTPRHWALAVLAAGALLGAVGLLTV